MNRGSWRFWVWTGIILLLVLPWTSFQSHTHWQRVAWIPFASGVVNVRDVLGNLLLYAPWGYLLVRHLPYAARHIWFVVTLAAILSFSTEASQLYSHGRFPSSTDFVCNVVGAFAGAMYARRRQRN